MQVANETVRTVKLHRPTGDGSSTEPPPLGALAVEHKQMLLRLARLALDEYLHTGTLTKYRTDVETLLEPRATFVTLTRRSSRELRGCRGECPARRSLVDSVTHMVIASATDDPRFPRVTMDEMPDIRIEISVLTQLEPIEPDTVVVGRHGLVIKKLGLAGLLLPQVPVSQGWDRLAFLNGLCQKAGIAPYGWQSDDAELYGFEADVWGESE